MCLHSIRHWSCNAYYHHQILLTLYDTGYPIQRHCIHNCTHNARYYVHVLSLPPGIQRAVWCVYRLEDTWVHTACDTECYSQTTQDSQYHGHTANTKYHGHQRPSPMDTPQSTLGSAQEKRHEGETAQVKVRPTTPQAASPSAFLPSSAWAHGG